jgi:hypothetical protein
MQYDAAQEFQRLQTVVTSLEAEYPSQAIRVQITQHGLNYSGGAGLGFGPHPVLRSVTLNRGSGELRVGLQEGGGSNLTGAVRWDPERMVVEAAGSTGARGQGPVEFTVVKV